jgi:glycine oxidase
MGTSSGAAGGLAADVAVIGGGIIGLAVAWRARQKGLSVTLVERDGIGCGASRVAAGMLAPVSEVEYGEHGRQVLDMGLRSAAMWPSFAAELGAASGREVGLSATGTMMVAYDDDDARELERMLEFRHSLGLNAERLLPGQAREREPALAPAMRLALDVPDDHSVDPRVAVGALRVACERAGVRLREHAGPAAPALDAAGERTNGVTLPGGELLGARTVVAAAGAWSGDLGGLPDGAAVPVRPVKGQVMRLRDPEGPGLLTRAVRYPGGYLVPRPDGRYVLGGTVEERGFDDAPTAGAAHELLRHAVELVPGVSELEIEELNVGLRPGTPDNVPLIGPSGVEGIVWATGHYRNGILLAPLTAELVAEQLS